MGTPYPQHNKHDGHDESELRGNQYEYETLSLLEEDNRLRGNQPPPRGDDYADDVLTLLEENARLRGLVVKLSNLILRNVAEQR
jgi:hypothetical protein